MTDLIGVLGAGQMGQGIAQVAAEAGRSVLLADVDLARATAAKAKIERGLARAVERGKVVATAAEQTLAHITPVAGVEALSGVSFAIEAAPEQIDLKRRLLAELDRVAGSGTILATNTSSISITALAAATGRPHKVIGMHFMNPVPRMRLVELVRGLATDDETYESTLALAHALDKVTVTSEDVPGFIVNRILIPLLNEACFALQEGVASAQDIDRGIELGLNHPMGPLALADLIGLDTCLAIAEVLHRDLGDDKYRPANILRTHVAAGWLGRKTGRGFYAYEGGR